MSSYKRLLNDFHRNKLSPTQEQIDRCLAHEEANKQKAAIEEAKTPAQVLAIRQARYEEKIKRRLEKTNMSYVEWEQQAKTYYTIDPETFTVYSTARSPNKPPESWLCIDMLEAQEKVLELMDYKYVDHFHKGHDFKWR